MKQLQKQKQKAEDSQKSALLWKALELEIILAAGVFAGPQQYCV